MPGDKIYLYNYPEEFDVYVITDVDGVEYHVFNAIPNDYQMKQAAWLRRKESIKTDIFK